VVWSLCQAWCGWGECSPWLDRRRWAWDKQRVNFVCGHHDGRRRGSWNADATVHAQVVSFLCFLFSNEVAQQVPLLSLIPPRLLSSKKQMHSISPRMFFSLSILVPHSQTTGVQLDAVTSIPPSLSLPDISTRTPSTSLPPLPPQISPLSPLPPPMNQTKSEPSGAPPSTSPTP